MAKKPSFTIGVEEEYMLVDRQSRDLIHTTPPGLMDECQALLKEFVSPEFLQCQIEVGTPVCRSVSEVRGHLQHMRRSVANVAEKHGLGMIAASTHPFALTKQQQHTDKDRYNALENDLQEVVRRLLICGMHVHVGIEHDDMRIDMMGQMSYLLPHLLALSTSSPFWCGGHTGLKSYRMAVWSGLPRTGLPETFDSYTEYQRHLEVLTEAGIIEDGSKIWWDLRPSCRYPTLEMRICDIPTRLDDGMSIAALYQCWLHMLYRLRIKNQRWRRYANFLIQENRWRAHRYGIDEGLIDFGRGEIVPYQELLEEIFELLKEDAEALSCTEELQHAQEILKRGTSAHRQKQVYFEQLENGSTSHEALQAVVDDLMINTLEGC